MRNGTLPASLTSVTRARSPASSSVSYAGGALHDLLGTYQGLFLASFAIAVMAVVLGVTLRAAAMVAAPRPSPALGG